MLAYGDGTIYHWSTMKKVEKMIPRTDHYTVEQNKAIKKKGKKIGGEAKYLRSLVSKDNNLVETHE